MMQEKLSSGRGALVTGGSRGIGLAIVERLLRDGYSVCTCARGERPAGLSDDVIWVQSDIAKTEQVVSLVEHCADKLGTLSVLVNNAGVQVEKSVSESHDDDWDRIINTNCRGVFNLCREVIPYMEKTGGCIVNIGSISGVVSDPSMALYNASKAFVHGLTRSIAVDHGPDIRCNAVLPGWIMTDMADDAFALAEQPQLAKADAIKRHPVGRFGAPDDIANMVSWLVSDEATYVTGQCFTVDGGLTAASPLQPSLF